MLQFYALVVDDQEIAAQASIAAIAQFIPKENIFYASDAICTMRFLEEKPISIAFLDIDMPDTSGFAIAEYIDRNMPSVQYVFLTGYPDFAVKSYDYEPLDFLMKPIDLMRLAKTFERLKAQSAPNPIEKIAVQTEQGMELLDGEEICYIERSERKVYLHSRNNKRYAVPHTMEEMEVILSDYGFFRCHQSYLVPLRQIISLRASAFGYTYEVVLTDGTVIPISRAKHSKLKQLLSQKGVRFV